MRTRRLLGIATFLGALVFADVANAWVFSEHTEITKRALKLVNQSALAESWRRAHDPRKRTCADPHLALGDEPCFGFAILPSLAGDHACNPSELAAIVAKAVWAVELACEGQRGGLALAAAKNDALARENVRRGMNITFHDLDPKYYERAAAAGGHFQLEREVYEYDGAPPSLERYLEHVLATGQTTNATALYANYHARALLVGRQARFRFERRDSGAAELTRRAFFTEAVALHFLQDGFSAGHVVGARGSASYRIGTHDYYSRRGFDARTWGGSSYHARGDAFLSPEDLQFAADATAQSVEQLLRVLTGASLDPELDRDIRPVPAHGEFDSCSEGHVPPGIDGLSSAALVTAIVENQPIPSRREPEFPRFRSEVGGFLGGAVTFDGGAGSMGGVMAARAGIRAGGGFSAITTRHMDNQIFVEAAVAARRMDADDQVAYAFRAHVPFYVVPFDGIAAFVLGAFFPSSSFFGKWASEAANGGLLGLWRVARLSENTTLQFSLLRDASLLWHRGHEDPNLQLFLPVATFRYALPFAGLVSSDFLLDIGTFGVWHTESERSDAYGGYLSLSTATRFFP
jgi:hypothetical protein